jgi:hypothetical protein
MVIDERVLCFERMSFYYFKLEVLLARLIAVGEEGNFVKVL